MGNEEPTATKQADAYERKFMADSGTVLHRERTVWKLHFILLLAPLIFLFVSGLGFAGVGTKPMPIPMAIAMLPFAAVMLGVWAMFIALRTIVTSREVMIQYGLFGPKIPLENIESCVARDYPQLAFGGGIKWVDGAWAYTLWGQGTRTVRLEWRDAKGQKHATIVSSPDPDRLAAAINAARASAGTGARIATDAANSSAHARAAEEEASAVEEASDMEGRSRDAKR